MIHYRTLTAVVVGLIALVTLGCVRSGEPLISSGGTSPQEKAQMPSDSDTVRSQSEAQSTEAVCPQSGLQVGETIASFEVDDVTGPAKGTSICYACDYGNSPVINVFIRDVTPENTLLIQKLDQLVAEHLDRHLKVFVVLLSMDPDADREQLLNLHHRCGIVHVPLTIFDGITGPKNCKIDQHATETVVMWNKAKVKSNNAFAAGQLNEMGIAAIMNDVPKILE